MQTHNLDRYVLGEQGDRLSGPAAAERALYIHWGGEASPRDPPSAIWADGPSFTDGSGFCRPRQPFWGAAARLGGLRRVHLRGLRGGSDAGVEAEQASPIAQVVWPPQPLFSDLPRLNLDIPASHGLL